MVGLQKVKRNNIGRYRISFITVTPVHIFSYATFISTTPVVDKVLANPEQKESIFFSCPENEFRDLSLIDIATAAVDRIIIIIKGFFLSLIQGSNLILKKKVLRRGGGIHLFETFYYN